jgi:hypothetical protein
METAFQIPRQFQQLPLMDQFDAIAQLFGFLEMMVDTTSAASRRKGANLIPPRLEPTDRVRWSVRQESIT